MNGWKSRRMRKEAYIDIECIIDRERERMRKQKGGGSVGTAVITRRVSQTLSDVANPFGKYFRN